MVIMPHDFFAWLASRVFTDEATFRRFVVFWGYSWFAIVKGWHAVEFALLFSFIWSLLSRFSRLKPRRNLILSAAFCALFAISDEYHQTFVPGRGGSWADEAIDCVGIGLAAILAWIWSPTLKVGGSRNSVGFLA
jgi:VanZ family protein